MFRENINAIQRSQSARVNLLHNNMKRGFSSLQKEPNTYPTKGTKLDHMELLHNDLKYNLSCLREDIGTLQKEQDSKMESDLSLASMKTEFLKHRLSEKKYKPIQDSDPQKPSAAPRQELGIPGKRYHLLTPECKRR